MYITVWYISSSSSHTPWRLALLAVFLELYGREGKSQGIPTEVSRSSDYRTAHYFLCLAVELLDARMLTKLRSFLPPPLAKKAAFFPFRRISRHNLTGTRDTHRIFQRHEAKLFHDGWMLALYRATAIRKEYTIGRIPHKNMASNVVPLQFGLIGFYSFSRVDVGIHLPTFESKTNQHAKLVLPAGVQHPPMMCRWRHIASV